MRQLLRFANAAALDAGTEFRQPNNIQELALFVEYAIEFVGTMFVCSDYGAMYVGGGVDILAIPAPCDAVTIDAR